MVKKYLRDRVRSHLAEVFKTKTSPHSIALGFAIGTFIGILPTPGFGVLMGLLVILVHERVNKLALFTALALWNPLTLVLVYWASYRIGDVIFGSIPAEKYSIVILNHAYNFTRRFLVGNLVLATTMSTLSYFTVKKIARRYQSKKGE
ncbi:MAG: DUF2062 domain-containing protein [Candidatus Altiarchaeota archaeon]